MLPTGIAVRIDLFAILILLGIGQGLFLSYFFLTGERRRNPHNLFLGLFILVLALSITEIFLCYTNYMFYVLGLIDFAEPFNFIIAPLSYLYIHSKLHNRFPRYWYAHFLPFVLYSLYSICWQWQPWGVKYNAYISAYHPILDYQKVTPWLPINPLGIRGYVNDLMLVSMAIYFALSVYETYQLFRKEKLGIFSRQNPALVWVRNILMQMLLLIVLFLIIKLSFQRDLGDHILAAHIALVIYLISFRVVGRSTFFQEEKANKKYEKSSLTPDIQAITLKKLEEVMRHEKPFLQPDFSLPALAKRLAVSPHHLSQILNEQLQQGFFEFVAQYRIEEAQRLLTQAENAHLKIEEIAERVGYNSKSSFNTSFKKIVGKTPSAFKKEAGT